MRSEFDLNRIHLVHLSKSFGLPIFNSDLVKGFYELVDVEVANELRIGALEIKAHALVSPLMG